MTFGLSNMPFRTEDPVLTVEGFRMRNINPQDPENLFGMWSVFHKCAGVLEDGPRLENMSWRLFTHETLLSSSKRSVRFSPSSNPLDLRKPRCSESQQVPELSSSLDSVSSDESDSSSAKSLGKSSSTEIPSTSVREQKRGREKPLTPIDLDNLVTSIKSKQDLKEPLPSHLAPTSAALEPPKPLQIGQEKTTNPRPASPHPVESSTSTVATATDSLNSPTGTSDTSVHSASSSHSVVRGFRPGEGVSTYRSSSQLAPEPAPILKSSNRNVPRSLKKKTGMFMLGGSSGDEDGSLGRTTSPQRKSVSIYPATASDSKKHASFSNQVFRIGSPLRTSMDEEAVIESDEEDVETDSEEEVDESAIDDDDDAWEDEGDVDDAAKLEKPLTFPRIDSKPNLVSRRSLITDKVHEGQRAVALENEAARMARSNMRRSRTSTPVGPSMPASPEEEAPIQGDNGRSDSKPIIMTTSNTHPPCPPAFSPRTTRRNMLAGELDLDLRKNMLLERQQKNMYQAGALQHRHTSEDVRNLSQYPAVGPGKDHPRHGRKHSWDDYFDQDLGEYHQKGW